MKKLAFSSALLAASGLAAAQSSVTLSGVVDATLQRGSGSIGSITRVGGNGNSSSRLVFRGVEDLGGGLSASFWLEAGFAVASGNGVASNFNNQANGTPAAPSGGQGLTFNRRSTVSVAGGWGELRLGRDFTVQYYNRGMYDPFGNNGVGISQTFTGSLGGPVSSRASNAVMYFLPDIFGGFYGEAQYYTGRNASTPTDTTNDGSGGGVRLGWKYGPLDVAVAHAKTQYTRTATAGDIVASNIGARWDIGSFSLMGGYFRDRVETVSGLTGRGLQVGGIYRVGVGEVKAQWSNYETTAAGQPETRKISVGYVHNLSKRTAVYATFARVNNRGGAAIALNSSLTAANRPSSGTDLGLRHAF